MNLLKSLSILLLMPLLATSAFAANHDPSQSMGSSSADREQLAATFAVVHFNESGDIGSSCWVDTSRQSNLVPQGMLVAQNEESPLNSVESLVINREGRGDGSSLRAKIPRCPFFVQQDLRAQVYGVPLLKRQALGVETLLGAALTCTAFAGGSFVATAVVTSFFEGAIGDLPAEHHEEMAGAVGLGAGVAYGYMAFGPAEVATAGRAVSAAVMFVTTTVAVCSTLGSAAGFTTVEYFGSWF